MIGNESVELLTHAATDCCVLRLRRAVVHVVMVICAYAMKGVKGVRRCNAMRLTAACFGCTVSSCISL